MSDRATEAVLRELPPAYLADRLAQLVVAGGRLVTLVGLDERPSGAGFAVEAVVDPGSGPLLRLRAVLPAHDPSYPSIARRVPAANWDEREIADLLGIIPTGHPDPRRLVLHEGFPAGFHPLRRDVEAGIHPPVAVDQRFEPFEVQGEGLYQLPVGPIHAGVIEPGHFRFSAVGESILYLDARLFFTHRGIEKLVEGRTFERALPLVERSCGVCTVTHALAFSEAVEALTDEPVPDRARWLRVLLAELERLYNHVSDLGNMCAGTGFQFGSSQLGWLKERLLRLNESITGHRYLTGVIAPGGLLADLPEATSAAFTAVLDGIERDARSVVGVVERSEGFMERLTRTGIVPIATAQQLGALGVAARASGQAVDARRDRPSAAYGELDVPIVTRTEGDAAARFAVRRDEVFVSFELIRAVLARLPGGVVRSPVRALAESGTVGLGVVEGPRGASWAWLRAGPEGTVDRFHLRTASFANWPVVATSVPGNLVPDFPVINKSFELCYACTDR